MVWWSKRLDEDARTSQSEGSRSGSTLSSQRPSEYIRSASRLRSASRQTYLLLPEPHARSSSRPTTPARPSRMRLASKATACIDQTVFREEFDSPTPARVDPVKMFYRSTQAYRSLDALRVSTCDDSAKRLSQPELLGAESRAGSSRTSSPLSRIYATGSRLAHRLSLSPSLRRRRDAQGDATSARAFTPIRRKRLSLSSDWTSHARAVFDWHAILSVVVSDHHHAQQSAPRKALVVGDPSPMWILHQAQRTGWEETRFHGITFEKQWLFTSHLPPELSGRIRLGRIEHDMQLSLELQSFDYALFFKPLNIDPKTSNAVGQNITNALKCGATFEIVHGPILAQEASANSAKPRKLAAQPALTGAKSMSSWTAEDLLAGSLKPEDENLLEVIWQRTTIARQHETERRLPAFASRNESTEHLSDQLAAAMQRSFDWFVSPTPPPQTPSSMSLHDFEAELKPSMSKLKKARKRLSSFGSLGMSRESVWPFCLTIRRANRL